ncbi:MAG: type II secretion system F family protein [Bacillota bacterium]|uniref:Secretion system protein n=1 Tax=Thermanaerosceptrum fracticalcis TaxID=1712410 RepID=A0A7G6E4B7_THEFR|nr:type II secretion system F family protein [Thermanaerosceptrum fracticalcis]QNB46921.1 secretion system protein [Thermanaerosceptrum fracticalcis]
MRLIIISITSFVSIFLALLWFYYRVTRGKRNISVRLEKFTDTSRKARTEEEGKERSFSLKTLLGRAGQIFVRRGMTKQLEYHLIKADIPLRGEEFLITWMFTALAPGTLIYILSRKVALSLLLYMAGIILPPLMISTAQQKRLKKFDQQIGDSLAIMSNALRAGFSFMQTLELVSREMPNPIAKEFARTFREMNLGAPMEQALHNLTKRVASSDLDLVVTAVLIQRQVGGNLAEVLDNISFTIRERVRIQGEIKTLTAQGKISGIIIGLIPPFLIVILFLINPTYLKPLFQSTAGLVMLAGGVISELMGLLIIKKIITIDI